MTSPLEETFIEQDKVNNKKAEPRTLPLMDILPDLYAVFWIALGSLVIYTLGILFLDVTGFRRLFSAIMLAVSVSVFVGYSKGVFARDITTEVRLLLTGILCTWLAVAYSRGYQIVYTDFLHPFEVVQPEPFWAAFSSTLGYFAVSVGGMLHLTAPGALGGNIPTRNWLKLGGAVGCGVLVALGLWYMG